MAPGRSTNVSGAAASARCQRSVAAGWAWTVTEKATVEPTMASMDCGSDTDAGTNTDSRAARVIATPLALSATTR